MRTAFRIKFGLLVMTALLVQGCGGGGGDGSVGASNFGDLPDSTRNIPVDSTSNTATGVIEANFVQVATSSIALLNNIAADSTAGRSDQTPNLTLANVLLGMLFDIEDFVLTQTAPPCDGYDIRGGAAVNSYQITIANDNNCHEFGDNSTNITTIGSVNIDNYNVMQGSPQSISSANNAWLVTANITISNLEFTLSDSKFNYTGVITYTASYLEENTNNNVLEITISSDPSLDIQENIEATAGGNPTILRDNLQNNFTMTSTYDPVTGEYSLKINGDITSRVTANPVPIKTDTLFSWTTGQPNPYTGKMTIFDSTSTSRIIISAISGTEVNIAFDNDGTGQIDSEDTFNWPINTN